MGVRGPRYKAHGSRFYSLQHIVRDSLRGGTSLSVNQSHHTDIHLNISRRGLFKVETLHIYMLYTHTLSPGLQEDSDHTAWDPISQTIPVLSSCFGSTPGGGLTGSRHPATTEEEKHQINTTDSVYLIYLMYHIPITCM